MPSKITIEPSGHQCVADDGDTILEAALAAGFMLPYGCRNGACGSCKGRLLRGSVDYGSHQDATLPAAEKLQGWALFCCAKPLGDVTIECRELRAAGEIPVRKLPCRVEKIERLAPDVIALSLKLPAGERLQFLAGQYIEFLLRDGRRRAFSLANAPHDDEMLTLHIRHTPGGHFTEHVFGGMKVRDILRFDGPHGAFHLREDSAAPILLIAGGTGFAPIKALIEHALHIGTARAMTLYWGARHRVDLYMDGLARSWAQTHPHIRYVPVLSEADESDQWEGRTGLVHRAVMADHRDLSQHEVYACGAPAMIDAARQDLVAECGLQAGAFFADAFTYASDPVDQP